MVAFRLGWLTTITVWSNCFTRFGWLRPRDAVTETGTNADIVVNCGGIVTRGGYHLFNWGGLAPGMTLRVEDYIVNLKERMENLWTTIIFKKYSLQGCQSCASAHTHAFITLTSFSSQSKVLLVFRAEMSDAPGYILVTILDEWSRYVFLVVTPK